MEQPLIDFLQPRRAKIQCDANGLMCEGDEAHGSVVNENEMLKEISPNESYQRRWKPSGLPDYAAADDLIEGKSHELRTGKRNARWIYGLLGDAVRPSHRGDADRLNPETLKNRVVHRGDRRSGVDQGKTTDRSGYRRILCREVLSESYRHCYLNGDKRSENSEVVWKPVLISRPISSAINGH